MTEAHTDPNNCTSLRTQEQCMTVEQLNAITLGDHLQALFVSEIHTSGIDRMLLWLERASTQEDKARIIRQIFRLRDLCLSQRRHVRAPAFTYQ
jgi:hypothetical protein